MRVLILGAYGYIGAALARRLAADGHEIVGLGRSEAQARRVPAVSRWIFADLRGLDEVALWRGHLVGIDAIINAAGALQDGARDDLAAVQERAMRALYEAANASARPRRIIQISAPGVSESASTAFFRTKAAADAALAETNLDWVIFRPGLVLSENAYGGTQLLRMLAAFPIAQPLMLADRRLQTVSMDDVCDAVARAVNGEVSRGTYDLVEPEAPTLAEIVAAMRAWLGFAPARFTINTPRLIGRAVSAIADIAGWLGWRSPLRSTAMKVLEEDLRGDPAPWRAIIGRDLKSLPQTLAALPATAQERLYARTQLLLPMLILTLSGFWLASGFIAFAQIDAAAATLKHAMAPEAARDAVRFGALADIALGAGLLLRRYARPAALAMAGLTLIYCMASLFFAPELWADPLGPMLKAIPIAAAALVVAAMLEER